MDWVIVLKIVIEEPREGEEEQVIFRCHELTADVLRIISVIKEQESLIAYDNGEIYRIPPNDIYYIEAVDNKTFLYPKDKVYESKQKLYELEELLTNISFLRISKSIIVNLGKISSLRPALNGRFEAVLLNSEKIIISRQYVNDLKKRLGI